MPIPTYDKMIEPLLRYLNKHPAGVRTAEAYEAIATACQLSQDERDQLLPSGIQPVFENRTGWAHDRLKRAGYSSSPQRGRWKITEQGTDFIARHPNPLTDSELRQIWRIAYENHADDARDPLPPEPAEQSPEEMIQAALDDIRKSVTHDLLERIGRASPKFFEQLVLEVLHKMGYGGSRDDLQRIGGPGDEGIDGIISLDHLGLEKVFIQAKRWQKPVGSPQIQGFMGALQLQGAGKGILLTTSSFTKDAQDAAAKAFGKIALVDGERLANLMIKHEVGVTAYKTLKMPRVDSDFFEDG